MSDERDLQALQEELDAEKRAAEALRAQYKKALQALRAAIEREAELQSLWAMLDGDAYGFE
jgi:hypothetical protein